MDRDRLQLVTPEGLTLELVLAGIGTRALAALIDIALQSLVVIAAIMLAAAVEIGALAAAGMLLGLFLFIPGYYVFFEARGSGQTPGKRRLGLRVVRTDGGPIGVTRALVRNLLRIVDFMPWAYVVGMVAVFASSSNQRLGDLAAGTVVVLEPKFTAPPPPPISATGFPRRVPADGWDVTAVTGDEVAVMRSFLDRRHDLNPDQRLRLAESLATRLEGRVVAPFASMNAERLIEAVVALKTAAEE